MWLKLIELDWRINMAIHYLTKSCSPIDFYTACMSFECWMCVLAMRHLPSIFQFDTAFSSNMMSNTWSVDIPHWTGLPLFALNFWYRNVVCKERERDWATACCTVGNIHQIILDISRTRPSGEYQTLYESHRQTRISNLTATDSRNVKVFFLMNWVLCWEHENWDRLEGN